MNLQYWIDEIREFFIELEILLKEDWKKFKKFIIEKKQFVFWIIVSFIGVQFVSIFTLGKQYDDYIRKHCSNISSMKGGGNNNPFAAFNDSLFTTKPIQPQQQSGKDLTTRSQRRREARQKRKSEMASKSQGTAQTTTSTPAGDTTAQTTTQPKTATPKTKLGRIERLSQRFRHGVATMPGPILGNMGIISNAVVGGFAIIGVLLAIAGVITIPFLLFMAAVYGVLKAIANYFGFL